MTDQLTHDLASESGISEPWLGELVRGMRAIANAPIRSDASQLVVRAAAEAQHRSTHTVRPARRRSRRGFVPVLRRGLVFNLVIGAVLVIGTAALAVGSVEAGIAPAFVEDLVVDLTERVGLTVTPPADEPAGGEGHPVDPGQAPGNSGDVSRGLPINPEDNPGHDDDGPGASNLAPGADKAGPPGQSGLTPADGAPPPGQANQDQETVDTTEPPGNSGTAPGQSGDTPPGQEATPPGQEATPPGQETTPPGQEATPPGQASGDTAAEDAGSPDLTGGGAGTEDGAGSANSGTSNRGGKNSSKRP